MEVSLASLHPLGFSWKAAQLLVTASELAYTEQAVMDHVVTSTWGYPDYQPFFLEETEGFVAADEKIVLLSFRGTMGVADWIANLNLAEASRPYGKIHNGFYEGFRHAEAVLRAAIEQFNPDGSKSLILTGHSLGGALACIAAMEFQHDWNVAGLYTFGQPLAGTADYAQSLDARFRDRYYRFVNLNDPITKIPPGYQHAGQQIWFDRSGTPHWLESTRGAGTPSAMSEGEFRSFQEDVREQLRIERTRGGRGAVRGKADAMRGQLPIVSDHALSLYQKLIEAQLTRSTPGAVPEPAPSGHLASAEAIPAPDVQPIVEEEPSSSPPPQPSTPSTTSTHTCKLRQFLSKIATLEAMKHEHPPLVVHIIWSSRSNPAGECARVAAELFEFLSHAPGMKPDLEAAVGIPVRVGHHFRTVHRLLDQTTDPKCQVKPQVVIVPLLDSHGLVDQEFRALTKRLADAHLQNSHDILLLPVELDGTWASSYFKDVVTSHPGESETTVHQKARRAKMDVGVEVSRFIHRLLGKSPKQSAIFISYARRDQDTTHNLARSLERHISKGKQEYFFDQKGVHGGESLDRQISGAIKECSLCLVLCGKNYSSSPYCQEELLTAKRLGLPIVTVQLIPTLLKDKERRTPAYQGNTVHISRSGPSDFVCVEPDPVSPDKAAIKEEVLDEILEACLQALLHHIHFQHEAKNILIRRDIVMETIVLTHSPELLDFAQGPISGKGTELVLYPDPPLPVLETNLIRRAYQRVRFATPTTLSREYLRRVPTPPLIGMRVAISLSPSPDLATSFSVANEGDLPIGPNLRGSTEGGLLMSHLNGAIAYLCLSLIRSGAEIGYGGHLLDCSYMHLLSELAQAHIRTERMEDEILYSYITGAQWEARPPSSAIKASYIRIPADESHAKDDLGKALEYSMMRRWMADPKMEPKENRGCDARVILGGPFKPRLGLEPEKRGYAGRFPGIVEEAYQHAASELPIYLIGGFGGAAELLTIALCNGKLRLEDTEEVAQERLGRLPKEQTWEGHPFYVKNRDEYDASRPKDDNLPANLDEMWQFFIRYGEGYFWGQGASEDKMWLNGLTVAENRVLFTSNLYDEISVLVLEGLQNKAQERRKSSSRVKLVTFNGSITDVLDVEGYAVMVLESAKLRGADGALDAKLNGALRARLESKRPELILKVSESQLLGDFVLCEIIGDLDDLAKSPNTVEWLQERVRRGARKLVEKASTNKIKSLAVVPFGVSLGLTPAQSVEAILEGINQSTKEPIESLAICELDPEHYKEVIGHLKAKKTDFSEVPSNLRLESRPSLNLTLRAVENDQIVQFARSPGGNCAVSMDHVPVNWADVIKLTDSYLHNPPPFADHAELGWKLAKLVLSPANRKAIIENQSRPWDLLIDLASSSIPFEMMCFPLENGHIFRPAIECGIRRGLLLENLPSVAGYARGPKLKLLMIANPTGDLPGTEHEATHIEEFVSMCKDIELTKLIGRRQATLASVLKLLEEEEFDLIHYAGHGAHGKIPERSGLIFDDGFLNSETLKEVKVASPPALVILNACQVAGMHHDIKSESLAQSILRAGVCGFVANRWLVEDGAAAAFAISTFTALSRGETLGQSVLNARQRLFQENKRDWCNYAFYGSPEIRL